MNHVEGSCEDIAPVVQAQCPGPDSGVGGDGFGEPSKRRDATFLLHGTQIEAANGGCERLQQE